MVPGKKRRSGARGRGPSPSDIIAAIGSPGPAPGRPQPDRRSPSEVLADSLGEGRVAPRGGAGEAEALLEGEESLPLGSFWGLWAQHQDYLRRHSLRWMSNNRADAEDALSTAMLLAQRKYPRHAPGIVNPRAWLTRLVHNVCMDHHRSMSRYELFDPLPEEEGLGVEGLPPHHPLTPGPDQEAVTAEMLQLLQKELRGLSPTLRDPLVLRCLHDLSYEEIAAHLRITESAVRKRVQLARDKLRLVIERP